MNNYEIHLPGRRRTRARQSDNPVIRISAEAYNALLEIGEESTLSIKDVASVLVLEAVKHVVYDR